MTTANYTHSGSLRKAIKATLAMIKLAGKIEDVALVLEMERNGWSTEAIEVAMIRIMDNVLHGLWVDEMGRVPVAIVDAVGLTGEDSWASAPGDRPGAIFQISKILSRSHWTQNVTRLYFHHAERKGRTAKRKARG